MNIFALDADPIVAAQCLCDQHLGKMLIESCQLLCNCHAEAPYKRTHYNHPCAVWTCQCAGNYCWLAMHGEALAHEYLHRFSKQHASAAVVAWCSERAALVDFAEPGHLRTPFAQAMPEQYRGNDAVAAYRRYYAAEKMILRGKPVTWTQRERPAWLPEKT